MSRPRMLALVAASALAVAGCGGSFTSGGPDDRSRPVTSGPSPVAGCTTDPPPRAASPKTYDAPPPMSIDTAKRYTATMETSCGRIVIRLDAAAAPKTVNNFVFLAREGFYDGLTFHRVVRDFVIQGGDPTGQGSGDAGYEFDDELPADDYTVGSVAMANAGPDTNGSQFFIVTGIDGEQLPHDYSRFGKVVLGMDAAKRIEALAPQTDDPTDPNSQTPRQKVYIFSVTISQS